MLLQFARILSLKGFAWYRAWVLKCHPNDTFDVRFTRPPSSPSEDTDSQKGATAAAREQRPEVETQSQASGSEEEWGSDEEVSWHVVSKGRVVQGGGAPVAFVELGIVELGIRFGVSGTTERHGAHSRENTVLGTTAGQSYRYHFPPLLRTSRAPPSRTLPWRPKKSGKQPAKVLLNLSVRGLVGGTRNSCFTYNVVMTSFCSLPLYANIVS